jgi:hypothetical protein
VPRLPERFLPVTISERCVWEGCGVSDPEVGEPLSAHGTLPETSRPRLSEPEPAPWGAPAEKSPPEPDPAEEALTWEPAPWVDDGRPPQAPFSTHRPGYDRTQVDAFLDAAGILRTAYRVLAFAIAALVAVQVAAIGYAVFAQQNWIDNGGTLDKAALESSVPGTGALVFHALNGGVVLLLALALLIIAFGAEIPQGVRWAVIVLMCTVVQIALGTLSLLFAAIGAVHGVVAFALFGVAVRAAMRVRKPAAVAKQPMPAEVA